MKMKSDDVTVLAGLAAATIKKGDAKAAEDAIAKLEKADPNSQDLPKFQREARSVKSRKSKLRRFTRDLKSRIGEIDMRTTFASRNRSILPSLPTTTT